VAKYHFHVDICSGGTGAAVAASSYQSGLKMRDDLNHVKKYENEERVVYTNLIAPDNAPVWAHDRQALWREVERKEGVKGQYARKYNIALPNELSLQQQIELADQIAEYYRSRGMCVDYAVHQDLNSKKPADQRNPHLHIMTTMRQFKADGSWDQKWRNVTVRDRNGKAICVGRDKNGRKRYKHVKMALNDWSERDELINQRRMVADLSNAALAKAGFSARVDHRSYFDQGIMLVPTKHLGHANAARERRGIHTPVGDYNRRAMEINDELTNANKQITQVDHELERIDKNVRKKQRKQRNNETARKRRRRNRQQQAAIPRKSFAAEQIKMYYMRKRLVATNDIANRSFAQSKSSMFMHSKRQRAELERRRRGQNNNNRLSKLQLMSWCDLTLNERQSLMRELNKHNDWVFATDANKHSMTQRAMFVRTSNGLHMYPLGRGASRYKPGDSISNNDMQEDCKAAFNAAGAAGGHDAGRALKSAANSISDAWDPRKTTWQHVKAAASDVKTIMTTPVTIAKDILSNPITGLLKAPLRVAAAGAKAASAVINTAAAVGKAGSKTDGNGGKSAGGGGARGGYGQKNEWDDLQTDADKAERRDKQLYRNI